MSLTGRNTLSLRKKDVMQQKQAGAAYKRLVFAHKATLGDTGINLTALVQPSEMATLGFVNPSTAELLAAKMLFYKKNLTVVSSAKGVLIQDLSYTVPTNERIAFQGFTAEADEIFTCVLESSVKDGLQVVDAIAISSTGELAIGDTDYNVGTPFEVGKNITTQMGSVLVFRDGVLQARNPNNGTSGGNYQEVDAGGGLGSIIRFNDAPVSEAASIIVVSNGMVAERPTGSIMAVVESLAGQMDQVIPTVAALAGQPETNFQAAPNNVDLKTFGDTVLSLLNLEATQVHQQYQMVLGSGNFSGAFTGAATATDGTGLFSYDSITGIYTFLKKASITCNFRVRTTAVTSINAQIQINGTTEANGDTYVGSGYEITTALSRVVEPGDTLRFFAGGTTNGATTRSHLVATAVETKTIREWIGL